MKPKVARSYGYFLSDWPEDEHAEMVKGVDYQVDDVYGGEEDEYDEDVDG